MYEGRVCRFSRNYTRLYWDINNLHKYPRRVNEIHSPVLFGFKGLDSGFKECLQSEQSVVEKLPSFVKLVSPFQKPINQHFW